MKLLLDTHAFLWSIGGSSKLSAHARGVIEDEENDRYLSVASLWEMAIKVSIGKLEVPLPFTRLVQQHVRGNAIKVLQIEPVGGIDVREDPDHLLSPSDLLDKPLQHIGRPEAFAIRLRQSEHGSRVVEAVLKGLEGRGSLLFQMPFEVVKPGSGLLLRVGFRRHWSPVMFWRTGPRGKP